MKKYLVFNLLIAGVVIIFALVGCSSKKGMIVITNSGDDVIQVIVEGSETKNMLGPNGTAYFDLDSKIQIGDAAINFGRRVEVVNTGFGRRVEVVNTGFGRRVEVVNTGSGQIHITHQGAKGTMQTIILPEGGTANLNLGASTSFKIGDVSIALAK